MDFFILQKKIEPSSAANAARIGRKRRQGAAVSERRRLEGADRRSARGRPVQVRELALYIYNPRYLGVDFFLQKEFEPSSAANAARIGRKRRQEAAVSERRRLEGADRKSARGRPVQVRELA